MHDAGAIDALTAKVNELAHMCARLSQENAELRGQVSALSARVEPTANQDGDAPGGCDWTADTVVAGRISRRAAVGVALAGAAAGIAGVTALSERGTRQAAPAADSAVAAELTAVELAAQPATAPTATGSVISATLSTASAVIAGTNTNAGPGVAGANTSTGAGVAATNSGTGPGVHATSGHGRGGIFAGAAAQIQLAPAGKSHPTSGQRGDLYADTSGRLWYCKTTGAHATWRQIA